MGYRLDDLWSLTFRQVDLALTAAEEKTKKDYDLAYYIAYYSGYFSQFSNRGKPLDYQKFAPNQKTKVTEAQSWKEQKSMAIALNAAFGGTFH